MPASGGGGEGGIVPNAIYLGSLGVGAGALLGCVQSAWTSAPPATVLKVFGTNVATHAGTLGAIAAVFGGTEALTTSVRGPGMANSMFAGCVAGSLLGLRSGGISTAASACGLFAGVQFVYQLGFDPEGTSPLSKPLTPPSNIPEPISYAKDYLHPTTKVH